MVPARKWDKNDQPRPIASHRETGLLYRGHMHTIIPRESVWCPTGPVDYYTDHYRMIGFISKVFLRTDTYSQIT